MRDFVEFFHHRMHIVRRQFDTFRLYVFGDAVKRFAHTSGNSGKRIAVAAERNRGSDNVFKIASFQKRGLASGTVFRQDAS